MTHQWSAILEQRTHRMVMRYHPRVGHLYVPGIRARLPHERGGYIVKTNALGFRSDIEFSRRTGERPRVFFFGDSFTDGQGCDNYERFSDVLGRELDIDAFNFGVSGSAPDQHLLYYEEFGKDLAPDVVVLCVAVHNVERIKMKHRPTKDRVSGRTVLLPKPYFTLEDGGLRLHHVPVPRTRSEMPDSSGDQYLDEPTNPMMLTRRRAPRAYAALRRVVNRRLPNAKHYLRSLAYRMSGVQLYDDYLDSTSGGWRLMAAIIDRFKDVVGRTPLLVVPLPTFHYFVDKVNPVYDSRFESLADPGRGLHVLPITRDLVKGKSLAHRRRFCYEEDGHFSPVGHAAVAGLVADGLRELQLLPVPPCRIGRSAVKAKVLASSRSVLGVSFGASGSAAALLRDGEAIAMAAEEVFTRKKDQGGFPHLAANYCLEEARLQQTDLATSAIAHGSAGSLIHEVERAIDRGDDDVWVELLGAWIRDGALAGPGLRRAMQFNGTVVEVAHGAAQAASAFFPSPFASATVVSLHSPIDGTVATIAEGRDGQLGLIRELRGLYGLQDLARALARFVGLPGHAPCHELAAIAPGGNGRFEAALRRLITYDEDGAFSIRSIADDHIKEVLGVSPRSGGRVLTQLEQDIAQSFQTVLRELVTHIVRFAQRCSQVDRLCVVGEPFHNRSIVRDIAGVFEDVWMQRATDHVSAALGVAQLASCALGDDQPVGPADLNSGPGFLHDEITAFLDTYGFPSHRLDPADATEKFARMLRAGQILGYFQGRAECTHATGARTVLADANNGPARARLASIAGDPALAPAISETSGALGDLAARLTRVSGPSLTWVPMRAHDEPVALTPFDAYQCMMVSDIDVLVLGDCLLIKSEQPPWLGGKSSRPNRRWRSESDGVALARRFLGRHRSNRIDTDAKDPVAWVRAMGLEPGQGEGKQASLVHAVPKDLAAVVALINDSASGGSVELRHVTRRLLREAEGTRR